MPDPDTRGAQARFDAAFLTVRDAVLATLQAIIDWTLVEGSLKSPDHGTPKRLAEAARALVERRAPFDGTPPRQDLEEQLTELRDSVHGLEAVLSEQIRRFAELTLQLQKRKP